MITERKDLKTNIGWVKLLKTTIGMQKSIMNIDGYNFLKRIEIKKILKVQYTFKKNFSF